MIIWVHMTVIMITNHDYNLVIHSIRTKIKYHDISWKDLHLTMWNRKNHWLKSRVSKSVLIKSIIINNKLITGFRRTKLEWYLKKRKKKDVEMHIKKTLQMIYYQMIVKKRF